MHKVFDAGEKCFEQGIEKRLGQQAYITAIYFVIRRVYLH